MLLTSLDFSTNVSICLNALLKFNHFINFCVKVKDYMVLQRLTKKLSKTRKTIEGNHPNLFKSLNKTKKSWNIFKQSFKFFLKLSLLTVFIYIECSILFSFYLFKNRK